MIMRRLILLSTAIFVAATSAAEVSITIENVDGTREELRVSSFDSLSMIEPVPRYVKDVEGKSYNVGYAGGRYWMLENLRVSEYDTLSNLRGTKLVSSTDSTYKPYIKITDNGALYNWSAATGADKRQGICPNKFHLPSYAELESLSEGQGHTGSTRLRTSEGWSKTIDLLYREGSGDNGFKATAEGYAKGEELKGNTIVASFWSADSLSKYSAHCCQMNFTGSLSIGSESKMLGRSVRCIWDGQTDRDWLYVYKPDTVLRYKVADILRIKTSDDIDNPDARIKDRTGNSYRIKRSGTTYWMQENLRTKTSGSIGGKQCDGTEAGVYYTYEDVSGGICPDGWRVPTSEDVRSAWPEGASSAIFSGTEAFANGMESMFWVSDVIKGSRVVDGRRVDFIWNVPYTGRFEGEWKPVFMDIYNAAPAMPCRCVRDLTEPVMDCRVKASGKSDLIKIWESKFPEITIGKDAGGDNVIKVGSGSVSYDAIKFN